MTPDGRVAAASALSEEVRDEVRRHTYIIVPAYNEEAMIGRVVGGLATGWPNVVVIDDGSSDATAREAGRQGAIVLRHVINRGQGAALQTGITASLARGARYIVTFDADGQHPAAQIPDLLAPLVAGTHHVALGSRFLGSAAQVPALRRLLLRTAVLFTRITSGARLTDTHNGFRAFSREAAARIELKLDRMAHASELVDQIVRMGLPWVEVPVTIRYTDYSRAKGQSGAAAARIAMDYLLGRLFD